MTLHRFLNVWKYSVQDSVREVKFGPAYRASRIT